MTLAAGASSLILTVLISPTAVQGALLLPIAPLLVAPMVLAHPDRPRRATWTAAIVSWSVLLLLISGHSVQDSLLVALCHGLEAVVFTMVLTRRAQDPPLVTVNDLARLLGAGAAAAGTIGLTSHLLMLTVMERGPRTLPLEIAASHGLALLVLLPLKLRTPRQPADAATVERRLHEAALAGGLILMLAMPHRPAVSLVPVLALVGVALRCRFSHLLWLYAATALTISTGTLRGQGPLAADSTPTAVFSIDTFLLLTGIIVLAVAASVAERRIAVDELTALAGTDPLTGLANRRALHTHCAQLQARSRRGTSSTLLLLDLDRFKAINDHEGHATGDRLLQAIAERLTQMARDTDLVARIGGDEFAVLLDGVPWPSTQALAIVDRIRAAVAHPTEGVTGLVTTSIGGVALDAGQQVGDLMAAADRAMYQNKINNRGLKGC